MSEIMLERIHICDDGCKMKLGEKFQWIPNPDYVDGKCLESGKRTDWSIPIKDYKENLICLVDPDEIVIDDNEITIGFDYPMDNKVDFTFFSNGGFTRKQIIEFVCESYAKIYQEENDTLLENQIIFVAHCKNCGTDRCKAGFSVNYKSLLKAIDGKESKVSKLLTKDCQICNKDYQDADLIRISPCGHSVHDQCIFEWFKKIKRCPVCIDDEIGFKMPCTNISCKSKSDELIDYILEEYPVIPEKFRSQLNGLLNRHPTNGKYCIWGHDLGDLWLEGLTYHKSKDHLLMLSIGS